MTPDEKRLNGYYRRKFGWTLEAVNALFARQNNVCAICHRLPGKNRLALDHDHAFDRVKLIIERLRDYCFAAFLNQTDTSCIAVGLTRKEARKQGKLVLRSRSIRGGLCLRCNKGLSLFEDSKAPLSPAERLENAAKYLRRFHEKTNFNHGTDAVASTGPSELPKQGTDQTNP